MNERTGNTQFPQRLAAVLIAVGMCAAPAIAGEKAVAPEHNPPGDIPDTQVFVPYGSPLGFTIKVPEGWARKTGASSARFADKYNTVDIAISDQSTRPTITSLKEVQVPTLESTGRAVRVSQVKDIRLGASMAVMVAYTSNSDPNPVTNKQIRLEHDRYFIYRNGKLATLDMAAPQGADNVDAWRLMAHSFRWR